MKRPTSQVEQAHRMGESASRSAEGLVRKATREAFYAGIEDGRNEIIARIEFEAYCGADPIRLIATLLADPASGEQS